VVFGISWDDPKRVVSLAIGLTMATTAAIPITSAAATAGPPVSVIVREQPGSRSDPDAVAASVGGRVTNRFEIIDGFSATVPASAVHELAATAGILSVTPDSSGHLLSTYDPTLDTGSMLNTELRVGARTEWRAGYTGKGVDIALIDSGVAPVNGLTAPGKIINGPDFSLEAPAANLRYIDTYGHGTHMAGIIAGRDNTTAATPTYATDSTDFLGMAPDARIVNIKVADAHGNTDVSQVLAAIDWVVRHRDEHGMHIRVLNLSFGTDSTTPYAADPLALATEIAWRSGIVVVAAAGNDGSGSGLTDPAYDPTILAVGAATSPTAESDPLDTDDVASFSSALTTSTRNADLVAPGSHIQSLRDPGSYIDQTYSATGLINSRFFRGSGTSQATAVTSGAAALIIQQHPNVTPDQVKALLKATATPINAASYAQGSGELNLSAALAHGVPSVTPPVLSYTPGGTLDGSRGSSRLVQNGVALAGDSDISGNAFTGLEILTSAAGYSTPLDSEWLSGNWHGTSFAGTAWQVSWHPQQLWSGAAWFDPNWARHSWSTVGWGSHSWSDGTWSSHSWSGSGYSSHSWSEYSWS